MPEELNPAEIASSKALSEVYGCLDRKKSFLLEAGAGAGKTYSLVQALKYLISNNQRAMLRNGQRIACITFTNVAKDEILDRTDRNPVLLCETIHSFSWSLIKNFQKELRALIPDIPDWKERIAEVGEVGKREIEYSLGHRSIRENEISLYHDDVLKLTIKLMECIKFRRLVSMQYPIILIDEYQDTNKDLVNAIKKYFLGQQEPPVFGFFGDHWQKIYGDGCGRLEHESINVIKQEANFRSANTIVDVLNKIRPELSQFVVDPDTTGEVRIYHSNDWQGERQKGPHHGGNLPDAIAHNAFQNVRNILECDGWDLKSPMAKILMLTHRILADEQGYSGICSAFKHHEAFSKKENLYIEYLLETLEPACEAYSNRKFGAMFEALNTSVPSSINHEEKLAWTTSMKELLNLRDHGTVGAVIDHLKNTRRPLLPDPIIKLEHKRQNLDGSEDERIKEKYAEIERLRAVNYSEIMALRDYLTGYSPFQTKHGVKGEEFENVLAVIGRGWSKYNFGEMLELAAETAIPPKDREKFERNRNLFYVVCSRAKRRLALLFTQELTPAAMNTLKHWFGETNIHALTFD